MASTTAAAPFAISEATTPTSTGSGFLQVTAHPEDPRDDALTQHLPTVACYALLDEFGKPVTASSWVSPAERVTCFVSSIGNAEPGTSEAHKDLGKTWAVKSTFRAQNPEEIGSYRAASAMSAEHSLIHKPSLRSGLGSTQMGRQKGPFATTEWMVDDEKNVYIRVELDKEMVSVYGSDVETLQDVVLEVTRDWSLLMPRGVDPKQTPGSYAVKAEITQDGEGRNVVVVDKDAMSAFLEDREEKIRNDLTDTKEEMAGLRLVSARLARSLNTIKLAKKKLTAPDA